MCVCNQLDTLNNTITFFKNDPGALTRHTLHIDIFPKEPPTPRSNSSLPPADPRTPQSATPQPLTMPPEIAPRPQIIASDPVLVEEADMFSKPLGHVGGFDDSGGPKSRDDVTKALNQKDNGGGSARMTFPPNGGEGESHSGVEERGEVRIGRARHQQGKTPAGQDTNGSLTNNHGIVGQRGEENSNGGLLAQEAQQNALKLLLASIPLSASPKPRPATPRSSSRSPRYGGNFELIGHEAQGSGSMATPRGIGKIGKRVPSPRTPRDDARQVHLLLRSISSQVCWRVRTCSLVDDLSGC